MKKYKIEKDIQTYVLFSNLGKEPFQVSVIAENGDVKGHILKKGSIFEWSNNGYYENGSWKTFCTTNQEYIDKHPELFKEVVDAE